MKALLLSVVFLLVSLPAMAGKDAADNVCTMPPANAEPASTLRDNKYGAWCSSQDQINELWQGMHLKVASWAGWGYENVCDSSSFLYRLMNAAYLVKNIAYIAGHFGDDNPPLFQAGHSWLSFLQTKEPDGFRPSCCVGVGNVVAWNPSGEPTSMCPVWAYQRWVATRASAIVHEVTHEDVEHVDADQCTPNTQSCDVVYGAYNANTIQINFDYDAAAAYRIENDNGVFRRTVAHYVKDGKEVCGYVPFLDEEERDKMLAEAAFTLTRFALGALFPKYADGKTVDEAYNAVWDCKTCNTADYTFSPETAGTNKACNEITNKDNVAINALNRAYCSAFNTHTQSVQSPEDYGELHDSLIASIIPCAYPDPQDLKDYCEQQKQTAEKVDDIDPYGFLGYQQGTECVVSYCQENFDENWSEHAGDPQWNDPLGCLAALCGGDSFCRKMFLVWEGDPDMYLRADEGNACKEKFLHCYDEAGIVPHPGPQASASMYDHPAPAKSQPGQYACLQQLQLCKAMAAQAAYMAAYSAQMSPMNPALLQRVRGDPVINPPNREFEAALSNLKVQLEKGAIDRAAFDKGLLRLMSFPESVSALYHRDPGAFVAAFGKGVKGERNGVSDIVGPAIQAVKAKGLQQP